jgi:hypothetical protein
VPDLVNGLGSVTALHNNATFGENYLPPNDDGSSAAINITSIFGGAGLNFFGTQYTTLYVNNNGNITFGGPLSQYIGAPIGAGGLSRPIIAAYWFDVDTEGGTDNPSPGGTSTGSNLVYYDLDTTNRIFTATWDDVGYYSSHIGNPNAFQIRLIDMGGGDFDIELIYEHINQSYSDTNSDPGEAPRAGYAKGNGTPGVELALSGDFNDALLLDTEPGNTGVPGYYYFQVRGGVVMGGLGDGPGGGEPPPPPRPATFGLLPIGLKPEGNEGETTRFEVVITRDGPDLAAGSAVTWEITLDDENDLAPGQPLTGTVFFAPFQTRATVTVDVQGDRQFEDDEWFYFHLNQVSFNSETWDPGIQGVGIILNDDPAVNFQFAGPATGPEGLIGASPIDFVVLRTGDLNRESTVRWSLETTGTADSLDFAPGQPTSGVVTFARGQSQAVIQINALGDVRIEPDETFTVRLTSATTGTTTTDLNIATTGTILDDDARQSVLAVSPSALVLPEGNAGTTAFNIAVMRVGDVSAAVNVSYAISLGGGLTAGEIQSALQGVVTFAAGASEAVLTVVVAGDTTPEDNESFGITFTGAGLNTLSVTGVVMNDDKVAGAPAGPTEPSGASPEHASAFMLQLMGGGLWSDGGAF